MKRKCSNCKTEFEFKVKDLYKLSKNSVKYAVKCPFCFTVKELFYNHKPRHLKGEIKK
jgi:hypothetical protein